MRILVLGGTGFVGRHLASICLARGHEVTLFHRGRSNPAVLPQAEHVRGDRNESFEPLRGRIFDIVFDTGGYEVPQVRSAARALRHPAMHYVFVSTISVYSDFARGVEGGPLQSWDEAETGKLSLERYGALKAACERALDEEMEGRVFHVRAGLILGPHDYDERFRYWLERIARGGDVLAPGDPSALTQAIDVRDLGEWMLKCAEERRTGPCNATGPVMTMRERLETIRDELGSNARFHWAPDEILLAHEVGPYSEMPFWLPASLGARPVDIQRALDMGLAFRPFAETVRDTWSWLREGWDAEVSVRENRMIRVPGGMSAEREAKILEACQNDVSK
ncbi:MAG TPA: NAD-dependent epimerase/dehydratase family protein [Polyangium sp.]|nr:NAD-dependent epimerase/dehydratase family protein [Polyangium sp.]